MRNFSFDGWLAKREICREYFLDGVINNADWLLNVLVKIKSVGGQIHAEGHLWITKKS